MNKPPYSTEDVENILRELAAQDKRTPMSDEFTAKMLRLIDDEVERGLNRKLYKRMAQVAASVALLAVIGMALMRSPENAREASLTKAPEQKIVEQPLPCQIALNELDALKKGMQPATDLPQFEDEGASISFGQFRITVCVDTL
ncbi:MAG: hypothetical protein MSQ05_09570 [Akkermansia sp.]|nr:hypothetical protein [Akkermansia sp.]